MITMTVKVCEWCGKEFPLLFGTYSSETNEVMNREFKNHQYYCEKAGEWLAEMEMRANLPDEASAY